MKLQLALFLLPIIHGLFIKNKSQIILDSSIKHAFDLMTKYPLVDSHNDLPEQIKKYANNHLNELNLTKLPSSLYATDILRLKKGKLSVQIWSCFVSCTSPYTKPNDHVQETLAQIDLVLRMIKNYPKDFALALNSSSVESIFKTGKIASLLGLEGGHQIGDSFSTLRMMYSLGVRYMTLTHTCHTAWADSCASTGIHGGISKVGEIGILEMNRLGMLVDISHVSHQAMKQAIQISKAPVIFSHSSAYALCANPRNVPDDVLTLLADNDGVVMVNFYPMFITCSSNATLIDVANHIDYIGNVAGKKHVGIGSDFDGIESVPAGLEDVQRYPYLIAEMISRGWTDQEIKDLIGGNFLRVFAKAEKVAINLQYLKTKEAEDK